MPDSSKKLIVQALYDYTPPEQDAENGLAFRKGDTIRVLHQLESGWWDGLCKEQRGFPSNYVCPIHDTQDANADKKDAALPHPIKTHHRNQLASLMSPGSATGSTNSITSPLSAALEKLAENSIPSSATIEQVSEWREKVDAFGRTYYYNVLTDETRWSDEHQEASSRSMTLGAPVEKPDVSPILQHPMTSKWSPFANDIIDKIETLYRYAASKSKENLMSQASCIVEAIRLMLYASDTAKKDSPALSTSKSLKSIQRQLIHSLSTLIITAKTASAVWPPPDAIDKLKDAAYHVLITVRQFVVTAQEAGVGIQERDSMTTLLHAETDTHKHVQHGSHQLLVESEKLCVGIINMIDVLVKGIRLNQANASSLIVEVKSIVSQVGLLLNQMDQVPLDAVIEELAVDFKVNRLALYNSISGLVMATQTAASSLAPSNAMEQVLLSSGLIAKTVKDLIVSTKLLLEERETMEQTHLNEYIRSLAGKSKMDGTFPKPRRAMSLSILNPSLGEVLDDSSATINPLEMDGKPQSAGATCASGVYFHNSGTRGEADESERISQNGTEPEYLRHDYAPHEIVYSADGKIRGGTLKALVERLTLHDVLDSGFVITFLLTYRSFTDSSTFVDLLKQRYLIQPPSDLTSEQMSEWVEKKQTPIRLRVINVMKMWVESYFQESEQDQLALEEIKRFSESMSQTMSFAAQQLIRVIEKRETGLPKKKLITSSRECPPPIIPRNLKKMKFLDLDPLEVARQLTIMENKEFNKIQPFEFLKKAWSIKDESIAVNVKAMVKMSNNITSWVAESILLCKDVKIRASYVKHFIIIAEKCRHMNNFNSLMAILAGLNSAPVHRLKRTFELLSSRTLALLDGLRNLMSTSKNFSAYRETIHSANPPVIPFLGFYLTDLTFLEDGNPDILKDRLQGNEGESTEKNSNAEKYINFAKRSKIADVIKEIQQFQNSPYLLTPVVELQDFLKQCFFEVPEETDLYELSLELEPREREDEKIARLLTESGFL